MRHLSAADTVTVSVHEAQSTTAQALRMIGWDDEAADVQAEIMTAAELCGNNQGLVKMFNPSLMAPAPGAGNWVQANFANVPRFPLHPVRAWRRPDHGQDRDVFQPEPGVGAIAAGLI